METSGSMSSCEKYVAFAAAGREAQRALVDSSVLILIIESVHYLGLRFAFFCLACLCSTHGTILTYRF